MLCCVGCRHAADLAKAVSDLTSDWNLKKESERRRAIELFELEKRENLRSVEDSLRADLTRELTERLTALQSEFNANRQSLITQLQVELKALHERKFEQTRKELEHTRSEELNALRVSLVADGERELGVMTATHNANKAVALQELKDRYQSEHAEWSTKMSDAHAADIKLSSDELRHHLDSERSQVIADTRDRMSAAKQELLQQIQSEYDTERAAKLQELNGFLEQLQSDPNSEIVQLRVAASQELELIDKFALFAQRIHKLQLENKTLREKKNGMCCAVMFAVGSYAVV